MGIGGAGRLVPEQDGAVDVDHQHMAGGLFEQHGLEMVLSSESPAGASLGLHRQVQTFVLVKMMITQAVAPVSKRSIFPTVA